MMPTPVLSVIDLYLIDFLTAMLVFRRDREPHCSDARLDLNPIVKPTRKLDVIIVHKYISEPQLFSSSPTQGKYMDWDMTTFTVRIA